MADRIEIGDGPYLAASALVDRLEQRFGVGRWRYAELHRQHLATATIDTRRLRRLAAREVPPHQASIEALGKAVFLERTFVKRDGTRPIPALLPIAARVGERSAKAVLPAVPRGERPPLRILAAEKRSGVSRQQALAKTIDEARLRLPLKRALQGLDVAVESPDVEPHPFGVESDLAFLDADRVRLAQ